MFIRWKGRYAYLEQRHLHNGKVICRSKYLGRNPLQVLTEMCATGEIGRKTYEKIIRTEPEGILKPTNDGGLNINGGMFGFLKGTAIGVFFGNQWLYGRVDKDEHGWNLADENGNIIGLKPGLKARLWF